MNVHQKTLLITGIGGFIGLRTAELALHQGMTVRGIAHAQPKAERAKMLGAEVFIGDVTDPTVAREACQGVDIVLHTAAIVGEGGSFEQFRRVNVGGTVNMAQAAKNAGVKTFVHLSSVMVYGFNHPDEVTENGPFCGENHPYCQTKIEAERELLRFDRPPEFGVIILRPGNVYGPGSFHWIVRPLEFMRKRLFILPNGGRGVMDRLYVDNLIDAIFLAIAKEPYGEAFNITDGGQTSWKEFCEYLAQMMSVPPPWFLPPSILKAAIRVYALAQALRGREPELCPASIDFIARPYACSIEKAKRVLGYEPKISLEEGMKLTRESLLQNGYR